MIHYLELIKLPSQETPKHLGTNKECQVASTHTHNHSHIIFYVGPDAERCLPFAPPYST